MLPKIEISTASYFPAEKMSGIFNSKYNESIIFKYIENTEALMSWDKHNYIKIIGDSTLGEKIFEKTETTHILVIALKLLHQYSKMTGEFDNVG